MVFGIQYQARHVIRSHGVTWLDFSGRLIVRHILNWKWCWWAVIGHERVLERIRYNIISQLPPSPQNRIFVPLEVLAWVTTAYWVLHSRLISFWRNMNTSSIFYFSKSTSINTQNSSLWDTLKMMLFKKTLIKWKHIGRISWKFQHWFNLRSIELDIKRLMLYEGQSIYS